MDKLIVLNAGSQLSIKLDGDNYLAWRIQFSALLVGFDVFGYVDGSNLCPAKTQVVAGSATTNPAYTCWIRQGQLILHGIVSCHYNSGDTFRYSQNISTSMEHPSNHVCWPIPSPCDGT